LLGAPEVSDGGLGRNPIAFLINKAPPVNSGLETRPKIPRTTKSNLDSFIVKNDGGNKIV